MNQHFLSNDLQDQVNEAMAVEGRSGEATDPLLLVGSLAFGYAAQDSDIDIFRIVSDTGEETSPTEKSYINQQGTEVNVIRLPMAFVEDLFVRFKSGRDALLGGDGQFHRFTEADRRMLHRLAKGIPYMGTSILDGLRQTYSIEDLNVYLGYYYLTGSYAYLKKAKSKGSQLGETVGWSMLLQSNSRLMGAVLAAFGETQPDMVWREFLIERLDDRLLAEKDNLLRLTPGAAAKHDFATEVKVQEQLIDRSLELIAHQSDTFSKAIAFLKNKDLRSRLNSDMQGLG